MNEQYYIQENTRLKHENYLLKKKLLINRIPFEINDEDKRWLYKYINQIVSYAILLYELKQQKTP
jgi:hypothetical protein